MEEYKFSQNYKKLAHAVILQAVKDYYSYYRRMMRNPKDTACMSQMSSIEHFFESEWFLVLTQDEIDGKSLIKKIKQDCYENRGIFRQKEKKEVLLNEADS